MCELIVFFYFCLFEKRDGAELYQFRVDTESLSVLDFTCVARFLIYGNLGLKLRLNFAVVEPPPRKIAGEG